MAKAKSAFSKLTPKRQAFVAAYLKHFNAARAAREAGYSSKADRAVAYDILTNTDVQAAVAEQMDKIGITEERITSAIAEIAFSGDLADLDPVFDGKRLSELRKQGVPTHMIRKMKASRRAVKEGDGTAMLEDIAVEGYSRLDALQLLAKVKAMFVDKVEHSGPGGEALQFQILRPEKVATDGQ